MTKHSFVRGTAITLSSRVVTLIIGLGTSVVLARALGPEGRGIYALAILLSNMIVIFGNFGIDPATVYFTARAEIPRAVILGNNVVISLILGVTGMCIGEIIIHSFYTSLFKGIAISVLNFSLILIPVNFFLRFVKYILLGAQRIKDFNQVTLVQAIVHLVASTIILLLFKMGVGGAIGAMFISLVMASVVAFRRAKMVSGGVKLTPHFAYIKNAFIYGFQAHLANILGFLNYRADTFLLNWLIGPVAAGLYSVGVDIIERGWLISQVAGMMILPRAAAAKGSSTQELLTPLVARTVFWITAAGVSVLVVTSEWVITFLYSESFLPTVDVLRGLAIGIVTLSVGRVLSNDIAGRGRPLANVYVGLGAIIVNITLNLLWIPRYGIIGAAWASSVSYTVSFLGALYFYCRYSENHWTVVVLPQREDWRLYYKLVKRFLTFIRFSSTILYIK